MEKVMLRVNEAAELVSVARTTFYKLIKTGEVPHTRLGKSIRISVAQLRDWAATRDFEAKPPLRPRPEARPASAPSKKTSKKSSSRSAF